MAAAKKKTAEVRSDVGAPSADDAPDMAKPVKKVAATKVTAWSIQRQRAADLIRRVRKARGKG